MDRVGKSTMERLKRALEDDFAVPVQSSATALADSLVLPGLWRFTRLGARVTLVARSKSNPFIPEREHTTVHAMGFSQASLMVECCCAGILPCEKRQCVWLGRLFL
jgi:hypothetical protein